MYETYSTILCTIQVLKYVFHFYRSTYREDERLEWAVLVVVVMAVCLLVLGRCVGREAVTRWRRCVIYGIHFFYVFRFNFASRGEQRF